MAYKLTRANRRGGHDTDAASGTGGCDHSPFSSRKRRRHPRRAKPTKETTVWANRGNAIHMPTLTATTANDDDRRRRCKGEDK